LIVSSLALHYVENLSSVVRKTTSWLKRGGRYIASVNHPIFTAQLPGRNGRTALDADNYWKRGPRTQILLGTEIIKYHETIEGYFDVFQKAGLKIDEINDLSPFNIGVESWEGDEELTRRPIFMLIAASKN
jgi:hypothetical protein